MLLKAIAWRESGWQQFWPDGRAKVASCWVGIMQVTAGRAWDNRRLAADYRYNIDVGALMLSAKMSVSSGNVPSALGPDDRRVLENWYRAVYRYNGAGRMAEVYADAVFGLVRTPPSGIRPWTPPVPIVNPKSVFRGYRPTTGHAYVARLDGSWSATLGRTRYAVNRADYLAYRPRLAAGTGLESGRRTSTTYAAQNIGYETWSTRHVTLGTWPKGRASRLRHRSWLTPTRPAALRATTPPGGLARFDFPVQAGAVGTRLTSNETFVPLVDGQHAVTSGRAASSWTLHPAQAPVATVTGAPRYLTDVTADRVAPLRFSMADPAPGSGVAYVEIATRQACDTCVWSVRGRVSTPYARVALFASGRHEVRVRAADRAGHVGVWSEPASVVVPRDDAGTELAFTGEWTAEPVSGSWLGSVASAGTDAAVETAFTGTSYAVIGTREPGLAPLSVYLDDVLVAVVEPVADETLQRQVLFEGTAEPGPHVVRVVVGGAGLRGHIDAIAVY